MSTVDDARRYRGVAAVDRRADRRARLETAALELTERAGAAAVTAEAVAAGAGLTKRYFYESFADRDALLVALLDELLERVRDRIGVTVAASTDSVRERIARTVEALVEELEADPRRARLYAEAAAVPALRTRREAAVVAFSDLLVDVVLRAPATDVRARLDAQLIVAGTTDVVSRWLRGELAVDRTDLVDELVRIGVAIAD